MQLFHKIKEISDLFEAGSNEQARHLLREILSNYVALHDETERQHLRIETLEKILEPEKNLFYAQGFFWLTSDAKKVHGPFCPKCMNTEGDLILLEKDAHGFLCPYCNCRYPALREAVGAPTGSVQTQRQAHIINFNQ
ncbi:MAG: hypothetical protein J5846_07255 [Desulfovibrio sp.]|nr:hypothetical protein [Desulfovibrio sp.]